jgi:hypothetical protein
MTTTYVIMSFLVVPGSVDALQQGAKPTTIARGALNMDSFVAPWLPNEAKALESF